MSANGLVPKKTGDTKIPNLKKEIKRRLDERRVKNARQQHPIVAYLAGIRHKFLHGIEPVGYSGNMVQEIMDSGLRALEFNLLAELIAQKEKEISEAKNKPIHLANISDKGDSPRLSRQSEADLKHIDPFVVNLYTKDKVPEKKYKEW